MNRFVYLFVLPILFSSWVIAQQVKPTPAPTPTVSERLVKDNALARDNVFEKQLDSKLMNRRMPYRMVLPPDYANSNETFRYAVIFLLHGLSGHYDNWTEKTRLADYAKKHKYIIIMSEGGNGWYTDSVSAPNDKFESYLIKELIPEVDKTFRTIADRDHRAIAGLSMGGYGGIKFGLKYPDMFSLAGSFSGVLGATDFNEKNAGAIGKSLEPIFGAEGSDTRKANDIFAMVRDLTPEKLRNVPYIYQSCGTEDFLFRNNRDFDALLIDKKVPHEYREHPGIHNWEFWDDQVREFLDLAERRLKR